jgi:hypothetical protein
MSAAGMSAADCGKRFSKGAAAISPSGVIPTVMRMRIAAIPIERNVRRHRSPDHEAPTSAKTSGTTIGERNIQKTFDATKNTDCLLHHLTGSPRGVRGRNRSSRHRTPRTASKRKISPLVSFS